MRKIHCDRCEKEISKMGECVAISINGLKVFGKINRAYDLCNACAKELMTYLEEQFKAIKDIPVNNGF